MQWIRFRVWINHLKSNTISTKRKFSTETTFQSGKWDNIIFSAICGFCILAFIDKNLISITLVTGCSMQPTLNPNPHKPRDTVLLDRRPTWDYSNIRRGDIVTYKTPRSPNDINIKRVVGLEGDTITTLGYKNKYVLIPPGHCWVEGDNSSLSDDSNKNGPISLGLITGRAMYVLSPLHRWHKLERKFPHSRVQINSYCDIKQLSSLPPLVGK